MSLRLRPIRATPRFLRYPEGSCLYEMGNTRVLCTASLSGDLPEHAKKSGTGWVSAEYAMLPRATPERTSRGRIATGGRTQEIQRLIGRSLRAVIDLSAIPGVGVQIDCDVLQADGGTRAAAINGAFIALVQALRQRRGSRGLPAWPVRDAVAAVSVGLVGGRPALDLDYARDARADVDLNVVMTGRGRYIEIQGTAERAPFSPRELDRLLRLARGAIAKILAVQRRILGPLEAPHAAHL